MRVQHLVVDSGGFINNAPIREMTENVYTLPDVVNEIKDKTTRERLQVLPYDLVMIEPTTDDIKLVTEFSKRTGDYPSLSATDIRLLALTVHLQSKHGKLPVNVGELKDNKWKIENKGSVTLQPVVGFYNPPHAKQVNTNDNQNTTLINNINDGKPELNLDALSDQQEPTVINNAYEEKDVLDLEPKDSLPLDEDDSWIGPDTLALAQEKMGSISLEDENAEVGCLTTDFAMQNVLLQLGLAVLSVKGFLVREAKTFILRCHACFNVTSIMTKKFCPRCGNQTLKRVAVSVGKDGQRKLHINFRKPINIRGARQSLPIPRGGKHGTDPILCEDQPFPQNRQPKGSMAKVNALDPDYEARASPFAVHDVHSRAAQLRSKVRRKPK